MSKNISKTFTESCLKNYKNNLQNIIIRNAMIKNGIDAVALNQEKVILNQRVFSIDIEAGKVTNQKQSGRCWMFAGLNTLRQSVVKKYKIKEFEFSECYLMFWDKFEKANYFLESIIDTLKEPIDSRIVMFLLQSPIDDGGEWEFYCNLVEKYGVVPKYVMPETAQSESSNKMNSLLGYKLRQAAMNIRNLNKSGAKITEIRKVKEYALTEVYSMLCNFLGEPPKKFDFEYYSEDKDEKDKKFNRIENLTPVEFYKNITPSDVDEFISLVHIPTSDKKFNTTYTVEFVGNIVGGRELKYLNIDLSLLKQITIKQLENKEPVWFGCDVTKMSDRKLGIMDTEIFLYDQALSTDFTMSKGERVEYLESSCTHAMVLTGVNLVNGKPNRWKVQNSWGDENGEKGYFVMSDKWFDEYTYQVVINKKYLTDELLSYYEQKPEILKPWDPIQLFLNSDEQ